MSIVQQRDYWPTQDWKSRQPQEDMLNIALLEKLHEHTKTIDTLRSILIVRAGYIIFEQYYHSWSQNHYQNVNSVTKSVSSALVGIALREGYLQSVEQKLLSFFPEYQADDARKQAITLQHVLSMSSGYKIVPGGLDTFLNDIASVEKMLARPLLHNPGEVYDYDDVSCQLLSHILTRVTGMPPADYAQSRLFEPLGIWSDEQGTRHPWITGNRIADAPHPYARWNNRSDVLWSVDEQGCYLANMGLQLTTREMATFGFLYLNRGQWGNQRILAEEYVQDSWRQHSITTRGESYGYLWFLPKWQGHIACNAVGYGGQLISVMPDLDSVVVITNQPEEGPRSEKILMNDFIIPALIHS